MRGIREHPRVAVVRAILGVCVVLVGFAIGAAASGGDDNSARATHESIAAQHSLGLAQAELGTANAHLHGAGLALDHLRARLSSSERTNRQLRRALRDARRASRHSKHHR
jgi:hypothetical protein